MRYCIRLAIAPGGGASYKSSGFGFAEKLWDTIRVLLEVADSIGRRFEFSLGRSLYFRFSLTKSIVS